nr:feruloyl CoA ortho-hydroxylase 1 [Tanacetum cinerariifolium]
MLLGEQKLLTNIDQPSGLVVIETDGCTESGTPTSCCGGYLYLYRLRILFSKPVVGGLYVKKREDSSLGNEDWIEIPPIHDALVVNIGDALQVIWSSKVEDSSLGNEDWIEIPPIPDALVVHIGDALQILNNGRYKSAEHQ